MLLRSRLDLPKPNAGADLQRERDWGHDAWYLSPMYILMTIPTHSSHFRTCFPIEDLALDVKGCFVRRFTVFRGGRMEAPDEPFPNPDGSS